MYKGESPLGTEIRRVVSRLKVWQVEQNCKTVMVTSSALGEGKSTFASSLAIGCSEFRGTKTVIVDFDLRRPTIHQLFGLRRSRGVAEILSGTQSLRACLKQTPYEELRVLTCGRNSQVNVSSLLNSGRIENLFSELKFYFDVVIVDAPPVIPVSDPLMLGSEIDGALFVVKAGKTQKPVVRRAVQVLQDAGITTLGVIINNVEHVLPYYYDYNFYGYQYYAEKPNIDRQSP